MNCASLVLVVAACHVRGAACASESSRMRLFKGSPRIASCGRRATANGTRTLPRLRTIETPQGGQKRNHFSPARKWNIGCTLGLARRSKPHGKWVRQQVAHGYPAFQINKVPRVATGQSTSLSPHSRVESLSRAQGENRFYVPRCARGSANSGYLVAGRATSENTFRSTVAVPANDWACAWRAGVRGSPRVRLSHNDRSAPGVATRAPEMIREENFN